MTDTRLLLAGVAMSLLGVIALPFWLLEGRPRGIGLILAGFFLCAAVLKVAGYVDPNNVGEGDNGA